MDKKGFFTVVKHFADRIEFDLDKKEIRIYKKPDDIYKNGRLTPTILKG